MGWSVRCIDRQIDTYLRLRYVSLPSHPSVPPTHPLQPPLPTTMPSPTPLNIISVPADTASIIRGKHLAPGALLAAGLIPALQTAGYSVTHTDALPSGPAIWTPAPRGPNGARNEPANLRVYHHVRAAVAQALAARPLDDDDDGTRPPFQLILGGGCDILSPVLSAYTHHLPQQQRIGLIYIDADADLATPLAPASTGTLAGMTLTHLLQHPAGLDSMRPFSRPDGSALVDAENLVLFGLNAANAGLSREHLAFLLDAHVHVTTSTALAAEPVRRAREALAWLESRVDLILVHLDVDAVDAGLFPLANVPQFSGAGFEAVMGAAGVFLGSAKAVGLVVAEVNPDHDPDGAMTGRLVREVAGHLGTRGRGRGGDGGEGGAT